MRICAIAIFALSSVAIAAQTKEHGSPSLTGLCGPADLGVLVLFEKDTPQERINQFVHETGAKVRRVIANIPDELHIVLLDILEEKSLEDTVSTFRAHPDVKAAVQDCALVHYDAQS